MPMGACNARKCKSYNLGVPSPRECSGRRFVDYRSAVGAHDARGDAPA
jgi:hypothetical protein